MTILAFTVAVAAATLSFTAPALAQTRPSPPPATASASPSGPESADMEFVRKAIEGGMKEVQSGKLAMERAASADVRAFAELMVTDHTRANAELAALTTMPPAAPAQKPVAKATLAELTGAAFDRAYMATMVTDHQATVELFEAEARDGKDDAVRNWASMQLPTIKAHLEKARSLHTTLTATSSTQPQ